MGSPATRVGTIGRGIAAAVRRRPGLFLGLAAGVLALDTLLPPLVLSVVRAPWTYFTVNPWLKKLPEYLVSDVSLGQKLDFLSRVALFWFTADGPFGTPEWGFAVDTMDLLRFFGMALLVATYFVLWLAWIERGLQPGWSVRGSRAGGIAGACVSVLGLSTGPCSVVGCGAPVLPVVGLALTGLTSGTLALLSVLSRLAISVVLVIMAGAVLYLGWRVGATLAPRAPATSR